MQADRHSHRVFQALLNQFVVESGVYPMRGNPLNYARFRAARFLMTLAALGCAAPLFGQCYYTYQEIPHPPGNPPQFTAGHALNNLGHVAGRYSTGGDTARAFFWSPETGTYLLPFPPGIIDMVAYGINDLDQVCGWMTSTTRWYGFIWDRETGQYTTMVLPAWATQIDAAEINNAGVVVGTLFSSREVRAFRWQNGVFYDLAADPGVVTSLAYDVNERGEIAGQGGDNGNDFFGYFAHSGGITWLPRPAEFSTCGAYGLSHTGFVAGAGSFEIPITTSRGVVWTPNSVHIISPLGGARNALMYAVNDAGRAVGATDFTPNGAPTQALVWQNGKVVDLNTLMAPGAPYYRHARDINTSGQVLAGRSVLTPVWLPGDLTGDCHVSIEDLVLVLTNFGLPRGSFPRGDVDSDGEVDISDLAILLAHWGE